MLRRSYAELMPVLLGINRTAGMKLGLSNMHKMQRLLGHDFSDRAWWSVHVAGTNGKGSVASKLAAGLSHFRPLDAAAAEVRAGEALGGGGGGVSSSPLSSGGIGCFTSPHVCSFRERIRVDGAPIDVSSVERLLDELLETAEAHQVPCTFFELVTLMALGHFSRSGVQAAVLEAGLGGRLDSTNVISPRLSVITSIGIDHASILGDTIDQIAWEKAGIIKPGVPVVVGPTVPLDVVGRVADERGSELIRVEGEFATFEEENTAIASAAMEHLVQTARPGASMSEPLLQVLRTSRPHCRFEVFRTETVPVVFDVAHNPMGIAELQRALKHEYPGRRVHTVLGLSRGKDVGGVMDCVAEGSHRVYVTAARSPRALEASALKEARPDAVLLDGDASIGATLKAAVAAASRDEEQGHSAVVVVCGSFYIMKEALEAVTPLCAADQAPPVIEADPVDLNEVY